MMFKKLIPLFLILVLSIQFLPLQRIAAWLSSGQITEEIVHGLNGSKAKSLPFDIDPALPVQSFHSYNHSLVSYIIKKYHHDEILLKRDADEIFIPPPNE